MTSFEHIPRKRLLGENKQQLTSSKQILQKEVIFISHVAQALWCEVFEMTLAAKDRSSGREHALGTCCGSSSCEEDTSLENSTQCSTSATSTEWKKANLIPKKPSIYNQRTY